ncbi:MAG: SpoIIE family protein phosphatase [Peptostreptococcales bacterium]
METVKFSGIYSRDFLFSILENMQDMVRIVSHDYQIVYMNKIMREKSGAILDKKCFESIGKTERCRECISSKSMETGDCFSKIEEVEEYTFSILSSPVYDSNTKEYLAVEVFRDITEEKKLEKSKLKQYEKMKKDLELAKKLQRKVLPNDSTYGQCVKITSLYEPSEQLGGDIYDVIEIDENRIGFYIADVSGHGITASLFAMSLRQMMKVRGRKNLDLTQIISALIRYYQDIEPDEDKYFTLLYGLYDKKDESVTFVNAGHNCLPIIISEGQVKEIGITGMPICSILEEPNHEIVKVPVKKGDRILIYTDGITEAYNHQVHSFFGYNNLKLLIEENINKSHKEMINKVYRRVVEFSDWGINDDIALLLLEII